MASMRLTRSSVRTRPTLRMRKGKAMFSATLMWGNSE